MIPNLHNISFLPCVRTRFLIKYLLDQIITWPVRKLSYYVAEWMKSSAGWRYVNRQSCKSTDHLFVSGIQLVKLADGGLRMQWNPLPGFAEYNNFIVYMQEGTHTQ